jgi:pantoate--beta-alanine ligase
MDAPRSRTSGAPAGAGQRRGRRHKRGASPPRPRRAAAATRGREGKTIALVPTMGALHEGHLSLVRAACERADYVVVSVFVNPTQFGPGEDFESYPRDLDADLDLLAAEGVDLVFAPSAAVMYEPDAVGDGRARALGEPWEGEMRPGHFTVWPRSSPSFSRYAARPRVLRREGLPAAAPCRAAHRARSRSRRYVVADPIVRDRDGLALSSRNVHLSANERAARSRCPRRSRPPPRHSRGESATHATRAAMRRFADSAEGL